MHFKKKNRLCIISEGKNQEQPILLLCIVKQRAAEYRYFFLRKHSFKQKALPFGIGIEARLGLSEILFVDIGTQTDGMVHSMQRNCSVVDICDNKKNQWKLSSGTAEGTANACVLLCSHPVRQICVHFLSLSSNHVIFSVCLLRSVPYFLALLFLVFTGENTSIQSLLIKTA